MGKTKKYLIILFSIIIIIAIIVGIILLVKNYQNKPVIDQNITNEETENVLVVGMSNKVEENTVPEPDPEPELDPEPETGETVTPEPPVIDAADLTTGIENLNMEIGSLYIPRTKLRTQVYCKQLPSKMDKMPCFLYTSGGLNKPGVTCITGHNRRNGKLFSNNKKLEVGDIFYFTDYEGVELKYTIYNKYITVESDTGFLNIESDKPVMALSCCTDASNEERIIILGRAEDY